MEWAAEARDSTVLENIFKGGKKRAGEPFGGTIRNDAPLPGSQEVHYFLLGTDCFVSPGLLANC
jgi:hypothetical protein